MSTYKQIRDQFNNGANSLDKATAFMYLNRAGYNGVYRVNREGKYNVPYGLKGKNYCLLPSKEHIHNFSRLLRDTDLMCSDFEDLENRIEKDNLVYIDPPYTSRTKKGYDKYTKKGFDENDQDRLFKFVIGTFILFRLNQ